MNIVSIRILQACGVIILLGLAILAYDRWVVRADDPAPEVRREQVAEENSLEIVQDADGLARAAALLAPFRELTGGVEGVQVAMRRAQPGPALWLIEFESRERTLIGRPGFQPRVNVPRLAVVTVFERDPGWSAFRQTGDDDAPPELPGQWHPRLAAMTDFRMGIEGPVVAFVSRIEGSALIQAIEARTSPEFHAGLLNSALRVDVQRALDIIGAMPDAPAIDRFYRIDVDVKLPTVDRSPLERAAAKRNEALETMRSQMDEIRINMEKEREALRERMAEQREEMRERSAERSRKLRESMEASRERLRERIAGASPDAGVDGRAGPAVRTGDESGASGDASPVLGGGPESVAGPATEREPERAGAL